MPTRSDRYSNVSGAVAYDQYALLLRFLLNKRMLSSIHWIAAKRSHRKLKRKRGHRKGAAFLIAVKKATSFGERVQKRKKADFGDDC
jgi:hypothetical protein